MKLHLGCGEQYKEGYVNIDAFSGVRADRYFDLSRPLDYEENSVEEILAYHLIEHLPFGNINKILDSWYKVLKPGGKLILEFPDFDKLIKQYQESESYASLEWIFGTQDRMGQTHLWGWNERRMIDLLRSTGFMEVKSVEPQDKTHTEGPILRIEAIKP